MKHPMPGTAWHGVFLRLMGRLPHIKNTPCAQFTRLSPTPYLELIVLLLAVLRVAVPVIALLTIGWALDRYERRRGHTTG
jgi:hypothetical protein